MITVDQIKKHVSKGERAVGCLVSLGGWELEAFALDGQYLARVFDNNDPTLYAMLTEKQYDSLYESTAWECVGAQSADDAAIVSAAHRWYQHFFDSLELYRLSANGDKMVRISD